MWDPVSNTYVFLSLVELWPHDGEGHSQLHGWRQVEAVLEESASVSLNSWEYLMKQKETKIQSQKSGTCPPHLSVEGLSDLEDDLEPDFEPQFPT